MFECFNCLHKSVVWDSDFDYDDFGLEGEGVVHVLHCANCGAEINYYVGDNDTEEIDNNNESEKLKKE